MKALELRIPPVVVAALVAAAMWAGERVFASPADSLSTTRIVAALAAVAAGVAFVVAGVMEFRRAGTTVNPLTPGNTSGLVCTGVYRITRNPMYLGFLMFLLGWAIHLGAAWLLAGPILFMLYMTRFQIVPEERALSEAFGAEFDRYRDRVGRWL